MFALRSWTMVECRRGLNELCLHGLCCWNVFHSCRGYSGADVQLVRSWYVQFALSGIKRVLMS